MARGEVHLVGIVVALLRVDEFVMRSMDDVLDLVYLDMAFFEMLMMMLLMMLLMMLSSLLLLDLVFDARFRPASHLLTNEY